MFDFMPLNELYFAIAEYKLISPMLSNSIEGNALTFLLKPFVFYLLCLTAISSLLLCFNRKSIMKRLSVFLLGLHFIYFSIVLALFCYYGNVFNLEEKNQRYQTSVSLTPVVLKHYIERKDNAEGYLRKIAVEQKYHFLTPFIFHEMVQTEIKEISFKMKRKLQHLRNDRVRFANQSAIFDKCELKETLLGNKDWDNFSQCYEKEKEKFIDEILD